MILGIETVTRIGSLAIVDRGKIVGQSTIDTTLSHTASLIPVLDNLLASINMDISEVDVVAVDVGPGSFTGIKVGIASAKGLTEPNNKRLLGVCSLEVVCYEVLKKGLVKRKVEYLVPFIDAKRAGIYAGWYRMKGNQVQIVKGPYLTTLKKLLDEMPSNSYIFGPDINMIKKEEKPIFPSAGTLAWLGEKKISEGLGEKTVEPMYIYDVEYRKS